VDGQRLPWLVGLQACDAAPKTFYSRPLVSTGVPDNRVWSVTPVGSAEPSIKYTIKSLSTGRCLTITAPPSPDAAADASGQPDGSSNGVVLLPCNASSAQQMFGFGKGLHSPSSIYPVSSPTNALAIGNDTLFSAKYGADPLSVPSASYGDTTLHFQPRTDQDTCTSRNCQNYDDTQMWYDLYSISKAIWSGFCVLAGIDPCCDIHTSMLMFSVLAGIDPCCDIHNISMLMSSVLAGIDPCCDIHRC
jgi:hypothetical protein